MKKPKTQNHQPKEPSPLPQNSQPRKSWTCAVDGASVAKCEAKCVWQVRGRCLGHLVDDVEADQDIIARVLHIEEKKVAQLAERGERSINVVLDLLRISRARPGEPIPDLPGLLQHVPMSDSALRTALDSESWARYAETLPNLFGASKREIREAQRSC